MPLIFRPLPLAASGAPAATPEFGWYQPFRASLVKAVAAAAFLVQPVCPAQPPAVVVTAPPSIGWLDPFDFTVARKGATHLLDGLAFAEQIVPAATPSVIGWQAPWAAPGAAKSFAALQDGYDRGPAPAASAQGWQGEFPDPKVAGVNRQALDDGFVWGLAAQTPVTLTTDIGWLQPFSQSKPKFNAEALRDGLTWEAAVQTPVTLTTDFGWQQAFVGPRPARSTVGDGLAWEPQSFANPGLAWFDGFEAPRPQSLQAQGSIAWAPQVIAQAQVAPPAIGWLTSFAPPSAPSISQTADSFSIGWTQVEINAGWQSAFEPIRPSVAPLVEGFAWSAREAEAPPAPAPAFGWYAAYVNIQVRPAVGANPTWTEGPLSTEQAEIIEPPTPTPEPPGSGGGWGYLGDPAGDYRRKHDDDEVIMAVIKAFLRTVA